MPPLASSFLFRSVAIRSHRPTSEPAAGTTYIRVYYIEMWRHFLREGGRNNLIIVSHRCGGGGSPPLNRAEWIRASVLFLSPSSAASSSRHHPPLASLYPSSSLFLSNLPATRKALSSTLCAASRICLESLDTDYLWLEEHRGEEEHGVLEKRGSKGKSHCRAERKTPDWLPSNGEMYREEHRRRKPQMASCKFVARFALCIRTTGAPPHLSILSLPSAPIS